MTLMTRLFADARSARRLRAVRAEIRRTDRATARRFRQDNPGYDDLLDPLFIVIMVLAVLVIVLDVRGEGDVSFILTWLRAVASAVGSWA
ncbi:hypothetical protein [Variovorax atrisoli]|uniref:hypothetical protein n=1 Tax=Variovorax atrisoli TaxID=3394203 RepID=UPI00339128A1